MSDRPVSVKQYIKRNTDLHVYAAQSALEMLLLCPSATPYRDGPIKYIRPDYKRINSKNLQFIELLEAFESIRLKNPDNNFEQNMTAAEELTNQANINACNPQKRQAMCNAIRFYIAYKETDVSPDKSYAEIADALDKWRHWTNGAKQAANSNANKTRRVRLRIWADASKTSQTFVLQVPESTTDDEIIEVLNNAPKNLLTVKGVINVILMQHPNWATVEDQFDIEFTFGGLSE